MIQDVGAHRTELNDRILCGDGQSISTLPFLYGAMLEGKDISSLRLSSDDLESDEVKLYNRKFPEAAVKGKEPVEGITLNWNIPEEYKNLNIFNYLTDKLKEEVKEFELTDDELNVRYYRVKMEIRLWHERGLDDMLRSLIFVVNTFEENKIIWGTGRGSSCASYILYLIGLHQVDSVEYGLDIGEFFR